ncbi:hypothetical protein [Mesobacillus jeotgali]|uniref:hypothetical protein n=1 Tax=Mesobacillus jeotgali TaxID=129985 RepID=UPI000C82DDC7|nr:hypothetical protein [Mesobacillus jeotgali]
MGTISFEENMKSLMMKYSTIFGLNSTGLYEVYLSTFLNRPLKEIIPKSYLKLCAHITDNRNEISQIHDLDLFFDEEKFAGWLDGNTSDPNSFDLILYVPEEYWPDFRYDREEIMDYLFLKGYIEMDGPTSINAIEMPLEFEVFDLPLKDIHQFIVAEEFYFLAEELARTLKDKTV